MFKSLGLSLMLVLLALSSSYSFGGRNNAMGQSDCPEPMMENMRDSRGDRGPRNGMGNPDMDMMRGYGEIVRLAGLEEKVQKYSIDIQRIFIDAKEKKLSLLNKRRDLIQKSDELVLKYETDKTIGKELIKNLKELNEIQIKLADINKESMDKIRVLHDKREADVKQGVAKWLQTLESNPAELDNLVQSMKLRAERIGDRRPPRK